MGKSSQEKKGLFKPGVQHKKKEQSYSRETASGGSWVTCKLGGGEGCFGKQKMSWRRRQNWRKNACLETQHPPLRYLLC